MPRIRTDLTIQKFYNFPYRNQHTSSRLRRPTISEAQRLFQLERNQKFKSAAYYIASVAVLGVGIAYSAVPLYQLICTQTGLDGTPVTANGAQLSPESMIPIKNHRKLRISFASSLSDSMKWVFKPQVKEITVVPGETALTFYTAYNPTDEDIIGISTYSVVPAKAAQYFNKIQCFCFEEQKLEAKEEVDMPVFFYIDPEFAEDPWMRDVNHITLHYTFFRSKRSD